MIELRTHEGLPSGSLRSDWAMLVGDDPSATVFSTPRYLGRWMDVFGAPLTLRFRSIHRDQRLIGVVPEARERVAGPDGPREQVTFLGGFEVTDYLGPVARPEDRDDVMAAWLDALAAEGDWDQIVAGGLATDTGWPEALQRHAERIDAEVTFVGDDDVCPRVDLAGGHDAWLERLPGKRRQEFRRKARKLARDAGEVELVEVAADQTESALAEFFEMVSADDSPKAGFFRRDEMREFFGALADEFAADGIMRIHRLDVGGRPGAFTVSFLEEREWLLYNSTFDQVLRSLSPGVVLVAQLIERAADEGMTVFDLLRGDEAYKYRFGATDRTLRRLTIERGTTDA